MTATPDLEPSLIHGALEDHKVRELPDGSRIEFEFAPAGWRTRRGDVRQQDHRAYFYTPADRSCEPCGGTGRRFDRSERGRKCALCGGSGNASKRVRLPSVTTILDDVCPKKGLPYWYEERGILGAIEAIRRGELDPYDDTIDPVARVRELKRGGDAARDERADEGIDVHAALEHYMRTGTAPNPANHPESVRGYYRALSRWLLLRQPRRRDAMIEELVCSPTLGYAGRIDLRATLVDGLLYAVDAKTSPWGAIHLGAHAQINLYERAAVECGDEPADRKLVVVFAADGSFREDPADHRDSFADAALHWMREARPVDAQLEARNKAEREARKAVPVG